MNKEAGLDPEDGGVDVPDNTDGITRYPSMDGAPIPADDVAKYDGENHQKIMEKNNECRKFVNAITQWTILGAEDALKVQ